MLKLVNISKYYHQNNVVAQGLRKVDLEFDIGEFIAVTGESGSGKSTLLNVISGLDSYEDGELYVNGQETSYFSISDWEDYRRQYIGFVFQNYNIIDSYTVLQNVEMALIVQGYDKKERRERALELIHKVGLDKQKNQKASKLSGGQKQRTVIARALAKDCPIIVADEPTGNLDSETGKKILELLYEISKNKLVIVVTHNFDEISEYATRKIRLFDGEVAEDKKIQKASKKEQNVEGIDPYKLNISDYLRVAFNNVFSVPKKTFFTVIVMIFMMLAFVYSYGSRLEQQSASVFPYSPYFRNLSESRLIVTKPDKTAFTQDELNEIKNINLVRDVVDYDFTLDYTLYGWYDTDWGSKDQKQFVIFSADALNEKENISKGRLPNTDNEVVLYESEGYEIGDTISLSTNYTYTQSPNMETSDVDTYVLNVVGLLPAVGELNNYYGAVFMTTHMINSLSNQAIPSYTTVYIDIDGVKEPSRYDIRVDDSLLDNQVGVPTDFLYSYGLCVPDGENTCDMDVINANHDMAIVSSTLYEKFLDSKPVTLVENSQDKDGYSILVNQNTYNTLYSEAIYQPSVVVHDNFDAQQVIGNLKNLGYNTFYPSDISNDFDSGVIILMNLLMFISLLFTMFATYFVGYFVLKNVMTSKQKDYLVYRSIGTSKQTLNRVSILEMYIQAIMGFIVMIGLLLVNKQFLIIPNYLRYFKVGNYVFLLVLILLLITLLGRRFNKKIFNKTVISSLKGE